VDARDYEQNIDVFAQAGYDVIVTALVDAWEMRTTRRGQSLPETPIFIYWRGPGPIDPARTSART